jgi:hypothetical protein
MSELPAHSQLGASSSERWMNCPGSVSLIAMLNQLPPEDDVLLTDPEYRRDGTEAHALAAYCLQNDLDCWEADDPEQWPNVSGDMMTAVQEYLDYVRALPTVERYVEQRVHLPDFHPDFFGTLDCAVVAPDRLHVVDYKHGVGVVVDAERNSQLMYYAWGYLATRQYDDSHPVALTIVQPRAFHPDGQIRSWETTVGHIREWAETELRPAMGVTQDLEYLCLGDWCRFCPAKLVCPAFDGLAKKALRSTEITYAEAQQLKMMVKAIEEKAFERLMAGKSVEGAKLVKKRSYRQWKEEAEQALATKFGQKAYETKLKSPAVIEKELGGKEMVAEFAFTPDAGYTVALATDVTRKEVKPVSDVEKYGDPAKYRQAAE